MWMSRINGSWVVIPVGRSAIQPLCFQQLAEQDPVAQEGPFWGSLRGARIVAFLRGQHFLDVGFGPDA
jgi:hypothetical protein